MKILLVINADTPFLCYEALSLAFALAAFDHHIQLSIGEAMLKLLIDNPIDKLANMLSALSMYDMPAAWVNDTQITKLTHWANEHHQDQEWITQLTLAPPASPLFDSTFYL